jgi:hypothetical protein
MELFLQCWGGAGYLFSKIFIARSEFLEDGKKWRLAGWITYLAALPAWVFLLAGRQNWIAAAIETAGIPSIILGIVITWKRNNNPNKYADWSIRVFTGMMILLGVIFSICTFGGIKTFSQMLEIVIIFGYLVSNYLLARRSPYAWLMFMTGLVSMGMLMYIQDKIILCVQQLVSLVPVTIGFIACIKKAKEAKN